MSKRKIDIEDIDGNFSGNVAGGNVKEKHTTHINSNNQITIITLVIILAIFLGFISVNINIFTPIIPTPTNTAIPTPSPTNTSVPTSTSTATPTPSPTNTAIPTPTNTATPTDVTISVCNLLPGDIAIIQVKKPDGKTEEISFSPGTKGCASITLASYFNNMSGKLMVANEKSEERYMDVIELSNTTIYLATPTNTATPTSTFTPLPPTSTSTFTPTPTSTTMVKTPLDVSAIAIPFTITGIMTETSTMTETSIMTETGILPPSK